MVGERGFEPPTPWSRTRCSTRLSHSPTVEKRDLHRVEKIIAEQYVCAKSPAVHFIELKLGLRVKVWVGFSGLLCRLISSDL